MSRKAVVIQSRRIVIAAGSSWILDAASHQDASAFKAIFAWMSFSDVSGGGTLTAKLQAATYETRDNDGWITLASDTLTADGEKVFLVTEANATLTGRVRFKVDCASAQTTFVLRAEVLFKGETGFQLIEWLPPTAISVTNGTDVTMPADQWADMPQFGEAFALLEFEASSGSGSNLTATMQTAPSRASDSSAWHTVDSSALTAASTQLDGTPIATNAPMGVIRLKYSSASGTVAGTLRAMLLLKDTN